MTSGYPGPSDAPQPNYGQAPQGQQPSYAQGQPPYGQPPYAQQQYADPGQQPAPDPAKKNKTSVIVTAIVVAVALIAAGVTFVVARSSQTANGAASAEDAVIDLIDSLQDSDPIGIISQLDPAEATLYADSNEDAMSQLKRLGIIKKDAKIGDLSQVTLTASDITHRNKPIVINDHVSVVEITGGTISVTSTGGDSPYSDKILQVAPELADPSSALTSNNLDISEIVADGGGPLRIAAVKRDDGWFTSVFYTIADNIAYQESGPQYADRLTPIQAIGSTSPQEAMTSMLRTAVHGDIRTIIGMLDPQEMGVLHDYGSLFTSVDFDGMLGGPDTINIVDADWQVTDVTGGKLVSLGSITIESQGQTGVITHDRSAGTITAKVNGQPDQTFSADMLFDEVSSDGFLGMQNLAADPQVKDMVTRIVSNLMNAGIVMVEGDGGWYISPIRSAWGVVMLVFDALTPGDIDYFLDQVN